MDETEEGTCVTVGVRHLRFWYVPGILEGEGAVTLQGRSAVLLDRCNDTFVDVCCAPKNRTFAISLARVLVEFNDRQLIGTYDLGGETPFSLVLGDNGLFIGFAKGIVRSFDIETTKLKTINCKPHSLHCSVTNGTSADAHCSTLSSTDWRLPNVRALCYNKKSGILTVECSDQSLYSWQNSVDGNAIAVLSSQHFHSASIFAVEKTFIFYEAICICSGEIFAHRAFIHHHYECEHSKYLMRRRYRITTQSRDNDDYVYDRKCSFLPAGAFITGAADGTIRIWSFIQPREHFPQAPTSFPTKLNVCWQKSKVIHLSDSGNLCVDSPNNTVVKEDAACLNNGARRSYLQLLMTTGDGLRSAIPLTGFMPEFTALGHSKSVYDLMLPDLPLLAMCETHEAEVMCLEYSDPLTSARYLMASGGRDRFIHIYDPLNGYLQLASIDDLASTVLSIVFASKWWYSIGSVYRVAEFQFADELILLSCASDKSIVLRKLTDSQFIFAWVGIETKKFDIVDVKTRQADKGRNQPGRPTHQGDVGTNVREEFETIPICGGKGVITGTRMLDFILTRIRIRASTISDERLKLHPGAALAAVVCTDRKVYIVNMSTGDCEACLSGMSGVVTDVAFSSDCRIELSEASYKMNNKQKRMKLAQEHTGGMLSKLNEELLWKAGSVMIVKKCGSASEQMKKTSSESRSEVAHIDENGKQISECLRVILMYPCSRIEMAACSCRSQTPECSFASENDVTDEETGKPSKVDQKHASDERKLAPVMEQVKDMESGRLRRNLGKREGEV
uniref:Uncharacterized protein n=1 Tax=Parascaris equorum TaxID=6256 RepID=A0A914RQ39_PAREQ